MTPEDAKLLADLDAAEKRATKGPWFAHENDLIGGWCVMGEDKPPSESKADVADFTAQDDAILLSTFRNALPRLLVLIRKQDAAMDASVDIVARLTRDVGLRDVALSDADAELARLLAVVDPVDHGSICAVRESIAKALGKGR